MNAYDILISHLQKFISKYYKNRLIKGIILFLLFSISFLLIIIFSETILYFSISVRTFLLYFFFIASLVVFVSLILIPILKILKIGPLISYKKSAEIISSFFPDIQDKLVNTLELYNKNKSLSVPDPLILAGIDQKSKAITVFNLENAVNLKQNFKYLKHFIIPILLFLLFYSITGSRLLSGFSRVINHDVYYEKPSPFKFKLLNDTLSVEKGHDYKLLLNISGEFLPAEVFINYSGSQFLMNQDKTDKHLFYYTFKNVNNDVNFDFFAENITSSDFELKVLPGPALLKFTCFIDYPAYTGLDDKNVDDVGDFTLPQGSKINWNFYTKNTDTLKFFSEKVEFARKNNDNFLFSKVLTKNYNYSILVSNSNFIQKKLINYNIQVIPDLFPSIQVSSASDTANFFQLYFKGQIIDDYGFKLLKFCFRTVNSNVSELDQNLKYNSVILPIEKNSLKQDFYYSYDFSFLNSETDKIIQYYFEVADNDGFNGSKSSKSNIFTFQVPDIKEISDIFDAANQNVFNKMDLSIQLANEIKSDLQKLKEMNLNNDMSEWENTQMLKDISAKQQLLENLIKETNLDNKAKNQFRNTFTKEEEELLKKQQEIQKLMDEILTPEMKELMKKLSELQNKFDKNQMQQLLDENKMSYDQLSEKLDRNKELLKRYDVEENISKTAEDLNKLSDKQDELSKLTENKQLDKDSLTKLQNSLKEDFDLLKDNFEKTLEKNKELKTPMKLDNFEEDFNKIQEEFKNTDENLSKSKNSKASKSQSQNSKNMKELSNKMSSMINESSSQQNSEDIMLIKKIVDNLLLFSFEQENLIEQFKNILPADPKYPEITKMQLDLKDKFKNINDSLFALAKRQPAISSPILNELEEINSNLATTVPLLEERSYKAAQAKQIKIMTSVNNLALLLDQVMDNMQNQQSGSGQGGGQSKPKPGGAEEALKQMKQNQEFLKKQMENMLKQMEQNGGKYDEKAMNKKLAQMLAQQEIYKQMMQEIQSKFSLNPETQRLLNEIQKLNEINEKELVNKKITPQLIERQKQITSRLLEAQNAENKRKTENKRESKEAENKVYKSAEDYFEKYRKNAFFKEDLYKQNIRLNQFYKNLNINYSDKINK